MGQNVGTGRFHEPVLAAASLSPAGAGRRFDAPLGAQPFGAGAANAWRGSDSNTVGELIQKTAGRAAEQPEFRRDVAQRNPAKLGEMSLKLRND